MQCSSYQLQMCEKGVVTSDMSCTAEQRWDRIWITGVDSDQILRFSFEPDPGSKF